MMPHRRGEAHTEGLAAHQAGFVSLGASRRVCRLGFGTMRLTGSGSWGMSRDRAGAIRVLQTAVDLGVQLIDTADSYGPAVAEELIAEALWPYSGELVITTKGGFERPGPDRWKINGRPEYLRAACEASLRRLKLECHPLYQLHGVDPAVPLADSLGVLVDMQAEGKIELLGISNVTVEQLADACDMAPIASVQNRFNHADRSSEAVLAECERRGLVFVPYGPLQEGKLSRDGSQAKPAADANFPTPAQSSLAWLLARSPWMVPIPGTSSTKHLLENVGAGRVGPSGAELGA